MSISCKLSFTSCPPSQPDVLRSAEHTVMLDGMISIFQVTHALELWEVFESEFCEMLDGKIQYDCDIIQSMFSLLLESGQVEIALRTFLGQRRCNDHAANPARNLASDLQMSCEHVLCTHIIRSLEAQALASSMLYACKDQNKICKLCVATIKPYSTDAGDHGCQVGLFASFFQGAQKMCKLR